MVYENICLVQNQAFCIQFVYRVFKTKRGNHTQFHTGLMSELFVYNFNCKSFSLEYIWALFTRGQRRIVSVTNFFGYFFLDCPLLTQIRKRRNSNVEILFFELQTKLLSTPLRTATTKTQKERAAVGREKRDMNRKCNFFSAPVFNYCFNCVYVVLRLFQFSRKNG